MSFIPAKKSKNTKIVRNLNVTILLLIFIPRLGGCQVMHRKSADTAHQSRI